MANTPNELQTVRYSDFALGFGAHPVTGDVSSVKNDASIKQALVFLFNLKPYERLFQSEIESPLYRYLFEPDSPIVRSLMKDAILNLIKTYEPRISVVSLKVNSTKDEHGYDIKLFYRTFQTAETRRFDIFLQRVN